MDMAKKVVALEEGTYLQWQRIGAVEGLPGDSEIGSFLVQLYSATKNGSQALHYCFLCRGHLSAVCNSCRNSQSLAQPSGHQEESPNINLSLNNAPVSPTLIKNKCWKNHAVGDKTFDSLYTSSDNMLSAPSVSEGTSSHRLSSLQTQHQVTSDLSDPNVAEERTSNARLTRQRKQCQPRLKSIRLKATPQPCKEEVTACKKEPLSSDSEEESVNSQWTNKSGDSERQWSGFRVDAANVSNSQKTETSGNEKSKAPQTSDVATGPKMKGPDLNFEKSQSEGWALSNSEKLGSTLSASEHAHPKALAASDPDYSLQKGSDSEWSDPDNSHSEREADSKQSKDIVLKSSSDPLCVYMGVEDLPKQVPSSIDHSYTERQKQQKVSDNAVFICKVCGQAFPKRHRLVNHIGFLHCHWRPFQCQLCPASFQSKQRLRRHGYVVHTKERPYSCKTCQASFVDRFALNCHQRTHQADRQHRYFCELCGKGYHSLNPLKKHLLTQHQQHHSGNKIPPEDLAKTVLCWVCGKAVASATYLKLHMRKHSPETAISCDVCCRTFTSRQTLDKHLNSRLHHNRLEEREVTHSFLEQQEKKAREPSDGSESVQCDLGTIGEDLDKTPSSLPVVESSLLPSSLSSAAERAGADARKKQRIRTGAFQCEICYRPFSSQKSVRRHKRDIHHMGGEKKIVFYEVDLSSTQQELDTMGLGEASRTATVLAESDQSVTTVDRSQEKSVSYKLKRNIPLPPDIAFSMNRERSSKKFTCDICHQSFSLRQSVRRHKRNVHLKRRDYHCERCPKTFTTSYYLKQHQQLCHRPPEEDANQTTVQCDVCHKDFVSKSAMVTHKRTVHYGLHRQFCTTCGKKFRDKFTLARHHKLCRKRDNSLTQTKTGTGGGTSNNGVESAQVQLRLPLETCVQTKTRLVDSYHLGPKETKEALDQHSLPAPLSSVGSKEMNCVALSSEKAGASDGNMDCQGPKQVQDNQVLSPQPPASRKTLEENSVTFLGNSTVLEAMSTSLSSCAVPVTSTSVLTTACLSSTSYTPLLSDLGSISSSYVVPPASLSPGCVSPLTSDSSKQLTWSPSTNSSNLPANSSLLTSNAALLPSHPALLALHSSLLASNLVPQEASPTLLMSNYAAFASTSGVVESTSLVSDTALLTLDSVPLASTSRLLSPNSTHLPSHSALVQLSSTSLPSNSTLLQTNSVLAPSSVTNPSSSETRLTSACVPQVSDCATKPQSLFTNFTPTSTLSALDSPVLIPASMPSTSETMMPGFVGGPSVASTPCFAGFSPIGSWMNTAPSFDGPVQSQGEGQMRPGSRLDADSAPPRETETESVDSGDLWNLR